MTQNRVPVDTNEGPVYFREVAVKGTDDVKDAIRSIADNAKRTWRQRGYHFQYAERNGKQGIEIILPTQVQENDPLHNVFDSVNSENINGQSWNATIGEPTLVDIEGEKMPESERKEKEAVIKGLKSELERKREELEEKRQRISEESGKHGKSVQEVERLKEEKERLQEKVEELEEEQEQVEKRVREEYNRLQNEIDQLEEQTSAAEDVFGFIQNEYEELTNKEKEEELEDLKLSEINAILGSSEENYVKSNLDEEDDRIEEALMLEGEPEKQGLEDEIEKLEEEIEEEKDRKQKYKEQGRPVDGLKKFVEDLLEDKEELEEQLEEVEIKRELYKKVKETREEYENKKDEAEIAEEAASELKQDFGEEIELGILERPESYSIILPSNEEGIISQYINSYVEENLGDKARDQNKEEAESYKEINFEKSEFESRLELEEEILDINGTKYPKNLRISPVAKRTDANYPHHQPGLKEYLTERETGVKRGINIIEEEFGEEYDNFEQMVTDLINNRNQELGETEGIGANTMKKISDACEEYKNQ